MSRPRSRSPMYSQRIPTQHRKIPVRHEDGPYTDQFPVALDFGPRREAANPSKTEGALHWDSAFYQEGGHVDHWARFIEDFRSAAQKQTQSPDVHQTRRSPPSHPALGYAERQRLSPKEGFRTQNYFQSFEERPHHSPQRLSRERLPSPNPPRYDPEPRHRVPSPGWRRDEHGVAHSERREQISGRNHRASRGSSPRFKLFNQMQGKRHDRMEHGFYEEDHKEKYESSFSERSRAKKPDFQEHQPPSKRSRGFGPQEERSGSHRGFSRSPARTTVVVEHDHGITNRGAMSRDAPGERRDHDRHAGTSQDRRRKAGGPNAREEPRMQPSPQRRRSPIKGRMRPMEPSITDSRPKDFQDHRALELNLDVDLRPDRHNRARDLFPKWGQNRPGGGKQGGKMGPGKVQQRAPYHHRNPSTTTVAAPRADTSEHETLKIKVDMNRPVGQNSSFSYSSDRQLSLDLVSVGRQRLDFLPMLEHSGTYRETAIHSGTFAQEIITLVHQVKENYFQGQGLTLNERFSSDQSDPVEDEEPIVNRRIDMSVSDTQQMFSEMGNMQQQRRQLVCDPSDLRHDLERRRQERLECVKVTIAGGGFSQMMPESEENEFAYRSDEEQLEDEEGDPRWSGQAPERAGQWGGEMDGVRQKRPGSGGPNFNAQLKFNRRTIGNQPAPHRRQNQNSANGANW